LKRARLHWGVVAIRLWSKSDVLVILRHPVYVGFVREGGETFPGEHVAIVDLKKFERAKAILEDHLRSGLAPVRNDEFLLAGLLRCAHCGRALSPVSSKPRERRFRYYRCITKDKLGREACPALQFPAEVVEEFVVERLRAIH
jgi:site-specific DNA recombinase